MWRWTKAATIEALEQRTKGITVAATKFEILNSKHETNSNYKFFNVPNRILATRIGFGHLDFVTGNPPQRGGTEFPERDEENLKLPFD